MEKLSLKEPARGAIGGGTGMHSLVALLLGILVIILAFYLNHEGETLKAIVAEILREFGLVLVSIFGISYLYEKLSARDHFEKFFERLRDLMRRGESNAAVCQALGVLEIHRSRESYRERHSFAQEVAGIGKGDELRLTGRSLIHALNDWGQFQLLLKSGGTLGLCMCDPKLSLEPLKYISRYFQEDSMNAIQHFNQGLVPWLIKNKPVGRVELRFHDVHLLDSLVEFKRAGEHRMAWDLNFGEGIESRYILWIEAEGELGRNLSEMRYKLIWDHAVSVFVYGEGAIQVNSLNLESPESQRFK